MEEAGSEREEEEEEFEPGEEEEEEEVNDEDAGEEEEDEEYRLQFDGEVDPLDLAQETPHSIELYRQFERLEYEALAERKRKALADRQSRDDPSKKRRQEELMGATAEEIEEMMNFGSRRRRRRSKDPKRRGVKKGTKRKLNPQLTRKLGDATLLYASQSYSKAIPLLEELVKLKPNLPDSYYLLGLIYYALGDKKKAMNFHMIAAHLTPKDPALWEKLIGWSIEQGNTGQVRYCLSKAITADPKDVGLRFKRALLYLELGEHRKAAESYHQIIEMYPGNIEARTMAAKMYQKSGQVEKAISLLEDYVNGRSSEAEIGVVSLLIDLLVEANAHVKALQHIERTCSIYGSEKKTPLFLTMKAAVCHAHLGNMEDAEVLLQDVPIEQAEANAGLITEVADSFVNLGHYVHALKFYFMLKGVACREKQHSIFLKIAQCYVSMKEGGKTIPLLYEALSTMDDNIDARITLPSLLAEEGREDDAITLLSPPKDSITETLQLNSTQSNLWWSNGKIKVQLSKIYLAKGMLEGFVDTIFPYVRETLILESRSPAEE